MNEPSEAAKAAFQRNYNRPLHVKGPTGQVNLVWTNGYDQARTDTAAAMNLMEAELKAWRSGQRIHPDHNKTGMELRARIAELENQLADEINEPD